MKTLISIAVAWVLSAAAGAAGWWGPVSNAPTSIPQGETTFQWPEAALAEDGDCAAATFEDGGSDAHPCVTKACVVRGDTSEGDNLASGEAVAWVDYPPEGATWIRVGGPGLGATGITRADLTNAHIRLEFQSTPDQWAWPNPVVDTMNCYAPDLSAIPENGTRITGIQIGVKCKYWEQTLGTYHSLDVDCVYLAVWWGRRFTVVRCVVSGG